MSTGNNNQEDDCCELLFRSVLDCINGATEAREKTRALANAALAVQQQADFKGLLVVSSDQINR